MGKTQEANSEANDENSTLKLRSTIHSLLHAAYTIDLGPGVWRTVGTRTVYMWIYTSLIRHTLTNKYKDKKTNTCSCWNVDLESLGIRQKITLYVDLVSQRWWVQVSNPVGVHTLNVCLSLNTDADSKQAFMTNMPAKLLSPFNACRACACVVWGGDGRGSTCVHCDTHVHEHVHVHMRFQYKCPLSLLQLKWLRWRFNLQTCSVYHNKSHFCFYSAIVPIFYSNIGIKLKLKDWSFRIYRL